MNIELDVLRATAHNILTQACSLKKRGRNLIVEGDTTEALRVLARLDGTPLWDGLSSIAKSVLCYLVTDKPKDTMKVLIRRLRDTADNLEANNTGDEQNG